MRRTSVVVVDDSITIRAMIDTVLERDGWLSVDGIAANAEDGLALIEAVDPDVVTLDINMPGIDGFAMLDHIMATAPRPVIMLSSLLGEGDPRIAEALERGAVACFNKYAIVREADRLTALIREAGRTGWMNIPAPATVAARTGGMRLAA